MGESSISDRSADALPDELTAIVLASVPWRDRLRCAAVCRSWERVLRGAHMWDDLLRSGSPIAHMRKACIAGDLDTARLIAEQFKITVEDIRAGGILRRACADGHLGLVQWLVTTFGLTAEDIRTESVLCGACIHGHLEVAQWLVTTFGLTAEDVRTGCVVPVLVPVYWYNFIEVAAWLIATFELTLDDVRGYHGDDLRLISYCARPSTIEWIVRHHSISGWEDRRVLVRGAAERPGDSLEALQHLHGILGFTAEEQHLAKHYAHGLAAEWLDATFGTS